MKPENKFLLTNHILKNWKFWVFMFPYIVVLLLPLSVIAFVLAFTGEMIEKFFVWVMIVIREYINKPLADFVYGDCPKYNPKEN